MNAHNSPVSTAEMVPIDNLSNCSESADLAAQAREFLEGMSWCSSVSNGWVARAWDYMIGVFLFQIVPTDPGIPQFLWVIVGDLPPAYLDVEYCPSWTEAMEGYVAEMQEWVDRVMDGRPVDDSVIPVNVPPEKEWAERLQTRLDLIRDQILEQANGEA